MCQINSVWPSDEAKTAFGILLMFIEFFIPFTILSFCYGRIVWVINRRINTDLVRNGGMSTTAHLAKDKFLLARRNTIKTLLIVGLCFIICWSQNQVVYVMYNCGYNFNFNGIYFQVTILMVFLNCTVNPFIYLVKYRDYQEALKKFFSCKNNGQESNSNINSSVTSISNVAR